MLTREATVSRSTVYPGVLLGEGTVFEDPCVLGKPARGTGPGEALTRIGSFCVIRPFTTIYAGAVLGNGVQTGQGASIREGNLIGDGVCIGTNAVLEHGNRIGPRSRVHSGCFLELVTLEEDVFVGPNVVFADDPHPPCPRYEDCARGAVVRSGARIGANCTVLPGVTIGRRALVGAGSVVTKDVPDEAVVLGNPARIVRNIQELTCASGLFERPYVWEEPR